MLRPRFFAVDVVQPFCDFDYTLPCAGVDVVLATKGFRDGRDVDASQCMLPSRAMTVHHPAGLIMTRGAPRIQQAVAGTAARAGAKHGLGAQTRGIPETPRGVDSVSPQKCNIDFRKIKRFSPQFSKYYLTVQTSECLLSSSAGTHYCAPERLHPFVQRWCHTMRIRRV